MSTSHTQIRVSTRVKRILDRRRRADESYNDFLERVLIGTSRIDRRSQTSSDPVSLHRKRATLRRNPWPWRLPSEETDTDD
jgi:hypothetical protein